MTPAQQWLTMTASDAGSLSDGKPTSALGIGAALAVPASITAYGVADRNPVIAIAGAVFTLIAATGLHSAGKVQTVPA